MDTLETISRFWGAWIRNLLRHTKQNCYPTYQSCSFSTKEEHTTACIPGRWPTQDLWGNQPPAPFQKHIDPPTLDQKNELRQASPQGKAGPGSAECVACLPALRLPALRSGSWAPRLHSQILSLFLSSFHLPKAVGPGTAPMLVVHGRTASFLSFHGKGVGLQ